MKKNCEKKVCYGRGKVTAHCLLIGSLHCLPIGCCMAVSWMWAYVECWCKFEMQTIRWEMQ